jgi:hypothetical protein
MREHRAVQEFVEHMVFHPEHVYDTMSIAELRRSADLFLRGYRGIPGEACQSVESMGCYR